MSREERGDLVDDNAGSDIYRRTLCRGLSWPLLHTMALEEAHASVPLGYSWCLFSYAREEMSLGDSSQQHAMLVEGLSMTCSACEPIPVQTMVAYYDVGDLRPRFEAWMFAAGNVRRGLVAWLCFRFRRPVAFWGEGTSLWALTPDEDRRRSPWGASSRQLGPFRPGAIAHAIRESAPGASTFLGFDFPAPSFAEAVNRASSVGDAL